MMAGIIIGITMVVALAWTFYGVLYSPRHRKFMALQKEFGRVNAVFRSAPLHSPESEAALARMGQIVKEEKKLLYG